MIWTNYENLPFVVSSNRLGIKVYWQHRNSKGVYYLDWQGTPVINPTHPCLHYQKNRSGEWECVFSDVTPKSQDEVNQFNRLIQILNERVFKKAQPNPTKLENPK